MLFPLRDRNPTGRFPIATLLIVLANVAAFVYQLTLGEREGRLLLLTAGAIPAEVLSFADVFPRDLVPPPLTIFTSMFLHGGIAHVAGNMWFLWIFGDNIEDALGSLRYLVLYFVAGAVGALAQCVAAPGSMLPMVGASGAIAGVLGAYIVLHPRARIDAVLFLFIFFQRIEVPAWVFLGLWFVGQFFIGDGSGVAWMAHVGGFLAGFGLVRLLLPAARRRPPPPDVEYLPPRRGAW